MKIRTSNALYGSAQKARPLNYLLDLITSVTDIQYRDEGDKIILYYYIVRLPDFRPFRQPRCIKKIIYQQFI